MHVLTDRIRARAAAGVVIALLACAAVVPTAGAGVMIYALTENDGLLSFDSDNPSRIIVST